MKKLLLLSFALLGGTSLAWSQGTPASTTRVDWQNGNPGQSAFFFRDAAGMLLSQGTTSNNDGMLVQLGYFSDATAANNFAGAWTPLTGFGGAPRTTIGDNVAQTGRGDGRIGFSTTFRFGTNQGQVFDPMAGNGSYVTEGAVTYSDTTPPNGKILSIRFYDTNTGTTGNFNTVSSDAWTWSSPTDAGTNAPLINLAFTTALSWESFDVYGIDHAIGDFKTVILVPEPSTYALIGLGAIGAWVALRRRSKASA